MIYEHSDVKIPAPRYKKPRAPDIAHVSIEEAGRNLIKRVDGVRTLIPPGFMRLAPRMETNQTLAELADLLGAQSSPVDLEDATSVERDVIHILSSVSGKKYWEMCIIGFLHHRIFFDQPARGGPCGAPAALAANIWICLISSASERVFPGIFDVFLNHFIVSKKRYLSSYHITF